MSYLDPTRGSVPKPSTANPLNSSNAARCWDSPYSSPASHIEQELAHPFPPGRLRKEPRLECDSWVLICAYPVAARSEIPNGMACNYTSSHQYSIDQILSISYKHILFPGIIRPSPGARWSKNVPTRALRRASECKSRACLSASQRSFHPPGLSNRSNTFW